MRNKSVTVPTATANEGPRIPTEPMAQIRGMHERMRAAREQLGAWDLDRAKLDSLAGPVRQRLVDDMVACDTLTMESAKSVGVDLREPGWTIDLVTGVLTKPA